MGCRCCDKRLNVGTIQKTDPSSGQIYKSCPHCSVANGSEHIFHTYPQSFGTTTARETNGNPEGFQSYCTDCRKLSKGTPSQVHNRGRLCSSF